MKITLVTDGIPPALLGGAGRIVCETAGELSARGHEVTIVTTGTDHPNIPDVHIETIPLLPAKWAHWRAVFGNAREQEVVNAVMLRKPDIVHAHAIAWQMGYRFLAALAVRGVPCIFTAHDAMTVAYGKVRGDEQSLFLGNIRQAGKGFNPLRTGLIRRALDKCHDRLAVSDALQSFLLSHNMPTIQTLHNGIDTTYWTPIDQKDARATLGLPSDATIFLLSGRVSVEKGSRLIAKILPSNAYLLVAGSANVHEFQTIADRIRFTGQMDAEGMRLMYAASDATLVPSKYLDPFPTVCLESMAMERPVIATGLGGAKEVVVDGQTGWIIDTRNEEAWRDRLLWCAANRDLLPQYGIAGRKHMQSHTSLSEHCDHLLDLYSKCIWQTSPANTKDQPL